MKQCSRCAKSFPDATVFCKFCGGPLTEETRVTVVSAAAPGALPAQALCPNCRTPHRVGALFCKECGTRFGVSADQQIDLTRAQSATANPIVALLRTTAGKLVLGAIGLVVLIVIIWISRGVKVSLAFSPADAQLFVDDNQVPAAASTGNAFVIYLGRGRHTLRAERQGYKNWTESLDLGMTDFSKEEQIKLEASSFPLTLVTTPPSSHVLLDGQDKGYSDGQNGTLIVPNVSLGKHSVTIEHDGYENWTQNVSVESSQMIRAQLTAIQRQIGTNENEIISVLQGWAASIERRDLKAHMSYYADTLDKYYNLTFVSSAKVRDDRSKAFAKYQSLAVSLSNFNIQLDGSGDRVTAVFDKNFDFRGSKYYAGAVQNRLTLLRMNGSWRIVGEEELQVYRTSSGMN